MSNNVEGLANSGLISKFPMRRSGSHRKERWVHRTGKNERGVKSHHVRRSERNGSYVLILRGGIGYWVLVVCWIGEGKIYVHY